MLVSVLGQVTSYPNSNTNLGSVQSPYECRDSATTSFFRTLSSSPYWRPVLFIAVIHVIETAFVINLGMNQSSTPLAHWGRNFHHRNRACRNFFIGFNWAQDPVAYSCKHSHDRTGFIQGGEREGCFQRVRRTSSEKYCTDHSAKVFAVQM
jgi:hypothetical protein